MSYTAETVYQVWDDQSGDRIEVGPDRDGLDLVEIRYYTDDGKLSNSITMSYEQAYLVYGAMRDVAAALEKKEKG